jgi:hypothetical protein
MLPGYWNDSSRSPFCWAAQVFNMMVVHILHGIFGTRFVFTFRKWRCLWMIFSKLTILKFTCTISRTNATVIEYNLTYLLSSGNWCCGRKGGCVGIEFITAVVMKRYIFRDKRLWFSQDYTALCPWRHNSSRGSLRTMSRPSLSVVFMLSTHPFSTLHHHRTVLDKWQPIF